MIIDENDLVEVKRILWHKKSKKCCLEFEGGIRRYPRRVVSGFYTKVIYLTHDEFKEFGKEDEKVKTKKWWEIWK